MEIRFETAEGSRMLVVESGDLLRDVMLNPPSGEKVGDPLRASACPNAEPREKVVLHA